MRIEADRLRISEVDPTLGLSFDIEYFSPVNQPVGMLCRLVTIANVSNRSVHLDVLDGLPFVVPAGITEEALKRRRRVSEAYAAVRVLCHTVPFFASKVIAHDEAEVRRVRQGNFYASWLVGRQGLQAVAPIVDPDIVFGGGHDLATPRRFITQETVDASAQIRENRYPCALVPAQARLEPGESLRLVALAGFAPRRRFVEQLFARMTGFERVKDMFSETRRLMRTVVTPAFMASSVPALDAYASQNYLDNVLRGGVPVLLPSREGPALLHLYSRRHGDLERDYNSFVLPACPLSSGSGNYRDILQNRRCDVWFYPDVLDREIKMFVSLLQADGYNPLSVEGYHWVLPDEIDLADVCPVPNGDGRLEFERLARAGFQPGDLLQWLDRHGVVVEDRTGWLERILRCCERQLRADGFEGGFWIDHWTYVTDLLDAYAGIFPDRVRDMLVADADLPWFDGGAYVLPRKKKYVLRPSGQLQLNAVCEAEPRMAPLPHVTVFAKLCALVAIKAVSFNFEGTGIEMEAGRPGWNDSLNGLPALFGSSTCEAAELARLGGWLRKHMPEPADTEFPVEVAVFVTKVVDDLNRQEYCWDRAARLREDYRAQLRSATSGALRTVGGSLLARLLAGAERRARHAIEKSVNEKTGLLHTYYVGKPEGLPQSDGLDRPDTLDVAEMITGFTQEPLPLYLEGQVHWLRLLDNEADARQIYDAVRESPLYDTKLRMYKINECLDACPPEIGRARTFTRGWFENESIWLHMSYKYLLELLRLGLYEEFFADASTMLVPFMDPEVYGRSILENSSFLASSANPDPNHRGRGFVARLSGSTAEFIHMWLLLTLGKTPFFVEDGELSFRLRPVLPGEWFTRERRSVHWKHNGVEIPENAFGCAFLGTTLLVYHNESRRDTFGPNGVAPVRYQLDTREQIDGEMVCGAIAERIRNREYERLDVWLE
jgi:hypothetical protein